MDVTITITLDEAQLRAVQAQLMRAQSSETVPELVQRMAQKIVNGWAEQNRQEFVQRNRPMVERLVNALAIDPQRDVKLAALGVRFVNGVLEDIPPGPTPEP